MWGHVTPGGVLHKNRGSSCFKKRASLRFRRTLINGVSGVEYRFLPQATDDLSRYIMEIPK